MGLYSCSKFGDSIKQKQGFGRVFDAAGQSFEFLEDAHDWYTRAAGETGEEGGDGLPGMGKSANHHLSGTRMGISESLVDPDKSLTMIREYKAALEDKANEAKRVEGDPIDAPTPVSDDASDIDKLRAWGNQIEAILDLGGITSPPIYLREYWEHPQDFWGGFSTTLERNFFCVRNFCRPPEMPLWGQRGVP